MTTEELMKPRYKVIADYPKSLYHVGDILNAGGSGEDCIYCDREGPRFRHYPHLFKPLAWYEERKPEDMPEYVKGATKVYKIVKYAYLGYAFIEGEINKNKQVNLKNFFPATLTDYLTYKQSNQ